MTKFWNCLLSVALSAFLLAPSLAEDTKPKKERPKAASRKEQPAVQLPKGIELNDEQKKKVAEIEKEFAAKVKEAREKLDKALTEEQLKARQTVLKEARTSGKNRKELQQAVNDSMKLSAEQQKQYDEANKNLAALRQEILEKVKPILTDDQKAKLPQPRRAEKKKPRADKKTT